MRAARDLVERFAQVPIPILLVGETGTGKELFAREIHRLSLRSGPLVDINCGAMPSELIEGQLFGHKRGAFTGAMADSPGLVLQSNGGTLFLDELPSLPLAGQAKLLRVIETSEFRALGETEKRTIDLRVIAAASNDIAQRVEAGALRRDLYQRLAGLVIDLPPLRDRGRDIVELANHFLSQNAMRLTEMAATVAMQHPWLGNVRELKAAMARVACLTARPVVSGAILNDAIRLGNPVGVAEDTLSLIAREKERDSLVALARRCRGDAQAMGAHLGISRATVYRRAKALGVSLRKVGRSRLSHRVSGSLETT